MGATATHDTSIPLAPRAQGKKAMPGEGDPLVVDKKMEEPPAPVKNFYERVVQPCVAEFVGVAVFVFIGTMSIQVEPLVGVAFAHGLTILLLIIGLGAISGGHFNPAVTLGVLIGGGISWFLALAYTVSQLLGSLLGAGLCRGVLSYPVSNGSLQSVYESISGGAHALGDQVGAGQGLLCETVLTFALVTSVLMAALDKDSLLAAFAIGLTVTVDILAAGNVTGASMNPARSFGPAVLMSDLNTNVWNNHWIYWLGPAIGALIAGGSYRLFFASHQRRILFKPKQQ